MRSSLPNTMHCSQVQTGRLFAFGGTACTFLHCPSLSLCDYRDHRPDNAALTRAWYEECGYSGIIGRVPVQDLSELRSAGQRFARGINGSRPLKMGHPPQIRNYLANSYEEHYEHQEQEHHQRSCHDRNPSAACRRPTSRTLPGSGSFTGNQTDRSPRALFCQESQAR